MRSHQFVDGRVVHRIFRRKQDDWDSINTYAVKSCVGDYDRPLSCIHHYYFYIPYGMKIFTEFNLAIWLRMVKFTELNISEF